MECRAAWGSRCNGCRALLGRGSGAARPRCGLYVPRVAATIRPVRGKESAGLSEAVCIRTDVSAGRRRPEGAARLPWCQWLLALVLVLAQVLLVTHEIGHISDPAAAAHCPICMVGGGMAHAALPSLPSLPVVATSAPTRLLVRYDCRPAVARSYRIRGPPLSAAQV
jgi:hypothetical protein